MDRTEEYRKLAQELGIDLQPKQTIRYDKETKLYSFYDICKILGIRNPQATYHAQIAEQHKGKIEGVDSFLDSLGITLDGVYFYLLITRKLNVKEVYEAINEKQTEKQTENQTPTTNSHSPYGKTKPIDLESLVEAVERLSDCAVSSELIDKLIDKLLDSLV